jgi:hypothetical protein
MGYAFVNLTTAEAARGLHYALHGARWKVHGTKKVIDIRAARIQVRTPPSRQKRNDSGAGL